MRQIDIAAWRRFLPGEITQPKIVAGSVALDGEREVSFSERDKVTIRIEEHAFYTVDVSACMRYAAVPHTCTSGSKRNDQRVEATRND